MELDLDEIEEFYGAELMEKFAKEHKILKKRIFDKSTGILAQIKNTLGGWTTKDRMNKVPVNKTAEEIPALSDVAKKILIRFVKGMENAIEEIDIPGIHNNITHKNCMSFCENVSKLYQKYNTTGRKYIPKFQKNYMLEIKELDMNLRKLGELSGKCHTFLRKKYVDGKDAEKALQIVPRMKNTIESITKSKESYELMTVKVKEMEEGLEETQESLDKILEDERIIKLRELYGEKDIQERALMNFIKFTKSLKKLQSEMKLGNFKPRDIIDDDLRKYIKSPIKSMVSEGPNIKNLRELLIKIRLMIEDPKNPLKMNKDKKEPVLKNIHDIINEKVLEEPLMEILKIQDKINEVEKVLEKEGLKKRESELRDLIAKKTIEFEHTSNDLKRNQIEYKKKLLTLSKYRDMLEEQIKSHTGNEIKVKVIIPE